MPYFFCLSGLFFRPQGIHKRIRRLLVPWISFLSIGFCWYVLKATVRHEEIEWGHFFSPLLGGTIGYENTPVWFLFSLATITLMAYSFCLLMKPQYALITSIVISICGYVLGLYDFNAYYLSVSMLCLPFFMAGWIFKSEFLCLRSKRSYFIAFMLSVAVYAVCPRWTNVSQNHIPTGLPVFVLVSIFATYAFVGFSRWADTIDFLAMPLRYFGRHSLEILVTHMLLLGISTTISNRISSPDIAIPLGFIAIVIADIPIVWLINKCCPWLLGIEKNIS